MTQERIKFLKSVEAYDSYLFSIGFTYYEIVHGLSDEQVKEKEFEHGLTDEQIKEK